MKWMIQEFLNNSSNVERMMRALEESSTEYLLIRVNNDNSLTVLEKESRIPLDNSDDVMKEFTSNEKIMVYGSKTFAIIAKRMGLYPGSFMNEKFEFEVFQKALGTELLNNELVVGELLSLESIANRFFIRPTGNTKLFTGMEITKEEFLSLQKQERELGERSSYIGQMLMMSPIREINAEYRFFVVNQQIVTGSSYKVGKVIDISRKPSDEILAYTKKMVDLFPLAKAFVIDIAETDKGFKVVEYNNINSSGLYGCDENLIVQAINVLQ